MLTNMITIPNALHSAWCHKITTPYLIPWHTCLKFLFSDHIEAYIFVYHFCEMTKILKSDQSQNTSRNYNSEKKDVLTWTPGYTRGGIRCLGWVSILCRMIIFALSPVPWSWMRIYPLSKSVCQGRFFYWHEKCQTTMKVCNLELDHCNCHRTCETLTSKETVEIPVTSICPSVVYPDS
jgi:hypothetical protein